MRRLFVIAALLGALGTTAAALAAGNPPITEKILGAGSISDGYTIDVNKACATSSSPRRPFPPARASAGTRTEPPWRS